MVAIQTAVLLSNENQIVIFAIQDFDMSRRCRHRSSFFDHVLLRCIHIQTKAIITLVIVVVQKRTSSDAPFDIRIHHFVIFSPSFCS